MKGEQKQLDHGANAGEAIVKEQECEAFFETKFAWDYLLFLIVVNLVMSAFLLVFYQHYRNSDLPLSEGGLIPMAPKY